MTSKCKVKIRGDQGKIKVGQEYDEPNLWDSVFRRVNQMTIVGISKLKDKTVTEKLSNHEYDFIKLNSWFADTKKRICEGQRGRKIVGRDVS